jgi:LuxR family maltose regulon positive regulatory protein
MEESGARVIVLQSPAGYGKTTLARQWAQRLGGDYAWCSCTVSSADIAAFALQIATASAAISTGTSRIAERLSATRDPEKDITQLAELVSEDLRSWPRTPWLIVDDYHLALASSSPERLLEGIIERTPSLRVLVSTRLRPSWVSARNVLYGQVLFLDRRALRMSDDEAARVLRRFADSPNEGSLRTFLTRADGWPAVIGLGALHPAGELPEVGTEHPIWEFMAKELLSEMSPSGAASLRHLALTPRITADLVSELLGPDGAEVVDEATRVGLLTYRHETYEMHPLFRSHLERELLQSPEVEREPIVSRTAEALLAQGEWDEAFELLHRFSQLRDVDALVPIALASLLQAGRLATLSRWIEEAEGAAISSPALAVAEAEVELRQGGHGRAESLALHAVANADLQAELVSRCYAIAGGAAHLRDDDERALQHFQHAAKHASSPDDQERAIWGEFVTAVQLERPDAYEYLAEMKRRKRELPSEVRVATGELLWAARFSGLGRIEEWITRYSCFLNSKTDPLIHTSFLNHYAHVLACSGNYETAQSAIAREIAEAQRYRLDFVIPLARFLQARCLLGLGRQTAGHRLLNRLNALALERRDDFMLIESGMLLARVALAVGDTARARELTRETPERVKPRGAYGEYLAYRALTLACLAEWDAAHVAAEEARGATIALEARTLAALAEAVIAVDSDEDVETTTMKAWDMVVQTGHWDPLVATYRARPAVAHALWAHEKTRPALRSLLHRARDEGLAAELSAAPQTEAQVALNLLSEREDEVLDLVSEGLSNQEIAERLFISLSTVKVHIRHIFEKLGARTRTDAALKYAEAKREGATRPQ